MQRETSDILKKNPWWTPTSTGCKMRLWHSYRGAVAQPSFLSMSLLLATRIIMTLHRKSMAFSTPSMCTSLLPWHAMPSPSCWVTWCCWHGPSLPWCSLYRPLSHQIPHVLPLHPQLLRHLCLMPTLSIPLWFPHEEFCLGHLPWKLEVLFINHAARDKKRSIQPCSAGPANAVITLRLLQAPCKGAAGKLWKSTQILLALLVAHLTHPPHAASHCSGCWVLAQEGGKKQERKKKKWPAAITVLKRQMFPITALVLSGSLMSLLPHKAVPFTVCSCTRTRCYTYCT